MFGVLDGLKKLTSTKYRLDPSRKEGFFSLRIGQSEKKKKHCIAAKFGEKIFDWGVVPPAIKTPVLFSGKKKEQLLGRV